MKKSKIVGLSLGFTALAAVAISTPFIVTSCSKATESNAITTDIKPGIFSSSKFTPASGAEADIQASNIIGGKNEVTIYTGENTVGVANLTLVTAIASVTDWNELDSIEALSWSIDGTTPQGVSLNGTALQITTTAENKTVEVTLKTKVIGTEKTAAESKAGEESSDTTETNKIEKELSVKVIVTAANVPPKN